MEPSQHSLTHTIWVLGARNISGLVVVFSVSLDCQFGWIYGSDNFCNIHWPHGSRRNHIMRRISHGNANLRKDAG